MKFNALIAALSVLVALGLLFGPDRSSPPAGALHARHAAPADCQAEPYRTLPVCLAGEPSPN